MDSLFLSRIQFGDTAAFHIIWPLLSIGLALFMFVLEAVWLYTRDVRYYHQVRFWSKIFVLTFGVGVATGIPLQLQFGTNWAAFSHMAGDFFGNILGFESTVAFALEAAFLGIFIFGWKRVGPKMHLFANGMVGLGATLSGFWIMVANSWMQAPQGVVFEGGKIVVTNYWEAIFTHNAIISFLHMQVACIEATLFFIAGLCALAILRKTASAEYKEFFLLAFKFSLGIAIIVTPLQIGLGDLSGYIIAKDQPAKVAAFELHWNTNTPGEGASWSLLALPAQDGGSNKFDVKIPNVLSLLTTHTLTGEVKGLNSFAPDDRPTVRASTFIFYAFRLMVGIGFFMFALMLLGSWYWYRGLLVLPALAERRFFLWLFVFALPLGIIATECGWMVREMGRQPWVVYHMIRTKDAVSANLDAGAVGTTLVLFTAFYIVFSIAFVYFTYRIMKQGPDLAAPPPTI